MRSLVQVLILSVFSSMMIGAAELPESPEPGGRWLSSSGLEFTWVPAGTFQMGSMLPEATPDQKPVHEVSLDGYWISVTEVPNELYDRFQADHSGLNATQGISTGSRDPAIWMSWSEAMDFCAWLAETEGMPKEAFRLPTEAEWERAARGDDDRPYPWGTGLTSAKANICDANCAYEGLRNYAIHDGYIFVSPVDSFPEGMSPYGCLNMAGNVREWCADWFDVEYYRSAPKKAPAGPRKGTLRVIRGGSYTYPALDCMTTARDSSPPTGQFLDVGFRVVLNP